LRAWGFQDGVELFLAEPGVLDEKPLEIRAELDLLGPQRPHIETSRFAIELERASEETPQTPPALRAHVDHRSRLRAKIRSRS
jgi:hypothetical protein